MDIHSRSLHKQIGITAPQLTILITLADSSPLPISEISKRIHLSVATVSGTLIRLEKYGLVERKNGLGDRRKTLIHITQKAQEIIDSGSFPLPDNFINNFNDKIPEWEKNMLLSSVQRISNLMQKLD
jgi:DNA-binding MarR family transcriptional regulator